jgi:hypothetical protein
LGGAICRCNDTILTARTRAGDTNNTTSDKGGRAIFTEVGGGDRSIIKTNLIDQRVRIIVDQSSTALHGSGDTSDVGVVDKRGGVVHSDNADTVTSAVGDRGREGGTEDAGHVGGEGYNASISESLSSLNVCDRRSSGEGEESISTDKHSGGAIESRNATNTASRIATGRG